MRQTTGIARRTAAALVALSSVLTLAGCAGGSTDAGEVVRMWVGPDTVACVGVAPMECLQVAYSEDGEPELFYDSIAGFEHEPGTAYVLDVRVEEVADPPADGSTRSYTLVDVVSESAG